MSEKDKGINFFNSCLEKIDLHLGEEEIKKLLLYHDLVIEKNKIMNLTTVTDFDEFIIKHFIDSLIINKVVKIRDEKIIDVGTGAGFPGIPIKIAFPDTRMVLLDSLKKRINFLEEVIIQCKLKKIKGVHGRAEEYGKDPNYRESFDLCLSRAVANLSTLSEYCIPFVKKGGRFISYKASNIEEELIDAKNAISSLGAEIEEVKNLRLPESDIERTFIIIRKVKETPIKYPRKAGKPSKEPLK